MRTFTRSLVALVLPLLCLTMLTGCLVLHHRGHHRSVRTSKRGKKIRVHHTHGFGCGHLFLNGRWTIIVK